MQRVFEIHEVNEEVLPLLTLDNFNEMEINAAVYFKECLRTMKSVNSMEKTTFVMFLKPVARPENQQGLINKVMGTMMLMLKA